MTNEHRAKHYLIAILFAVFFPPLMILLHEVGHYSAARLLGYSPFLSYAEITVFQRMERTHEFLLTLAGPCVDLLFCVLGVAGLLRLGRSLPTHRCWEVWLWSAFAISGFRWIKIPFDGVQSDEAGMSALLGLHHLLIPLALVPPAAVAVGILIRFHLRNHTLLPYAASFAASALSVLVWFTLLGPALLPIPSPPRHVQRRTVLRGGGCSAISSLLRPERSLRCFPLAATLRMAIQVSLTRQGTLVAGRVCEKC